MKKVLFVLAITFSVAMFSSCEKCKQCTLTSVTTTDPPTDGFPQTSEATFEACGSELKDIDGQTITSTSTVGDYTATVKNTYDCK